MIADRALQHIRRSASYGRILQDLWVIHCNNRCGWRGSQMDIEHSATALRFPFVFVLTLPAPFLRPFIEFAWRTIDPRKNGSNKAPTKQSERTQPKQPRP